MEKSVDPDQMASSLIARSHLYSYFYSIYSLYENAQGFM